MADGEPGARHRSAPTLQVQPIVGISEPELHTIGIVAIALLGRSLRHPKFAGAHGIVARHHRSLRADRIDLAPNFEGHDQDLVTELLLYRQIGVGAIASEHLVEKDLVSVEDLHIHVGGRGIEHDRPSERLEGRVRQRPACMPGGAGDAKKKRLLAPIWSKELLSGIAPEEKVNIAFLEAIWLLSRSPWWI